MNDPCKLDETLLDYTAGRLSPDKTATLDLHMQTCPDCAALRLEQTAVWDALDAWEPAPVSVDFNRRLWQRIDAAEAAPWYQRLGDSFRFGNWKPAFALTAAMIVIAAGFVLDHPAERATTGAEGVSTTEAEQVEQTLEDLQLLHQFDSFTPAAAPKQM